jgi:hypothetical protein
VESCLKRRLARRANRRHARWRIAAAVALASMATTMLATPAHAEVAIGQIPPTPPSPTCMSGADYLQPSVTGGNLYTAREAGTITSWSTNSFSPGATYVFKIFRRTSDPDVFQVISHAPAHPLTAGVNSVPVSLPVRSGDMIGINESGGLNSCTFDTPGDAVLIRSGNLSDGASGGFGPVSDVRLNLSAVLVPSNDFTVGPVTRDRRQGTASLMVHVSNPGLVTVSGPGLKKRHAAKPVALAGPVQFGIAAVGARKRRLARTGKLTVNPTVTFYPTGGDPASKPTTVRLRKRRSKAAGSP